MIGLSENLSVPAVPKPGSVALEQALQEICVAFHPCYGHLFTCEPGTQELTLEYHFSQGKLHEGRSGEAPIFAEQSLSGTSQRWFQNREPVFIDHALPVHSSAWPELVHWHTARGRDFSCLVPLWAGDLPVGVVELSWTRKFLFSQSQRELLRVLCERAGTAILVGAWSRARRKHLAAENRAATLARSNAALQATVETLGGLKNFDDLVPRALEITAEAFGAKSCSIFKNEASGRVTLLYWYCNGKTFLPEEMLQLDGEKLALIRTLGQGFEVPDSYLGGPVAAVLGPVIIDHVAGTSVPEFDNFACLNGWDLELNVGVGANARRFTTLCIYRGRSHPYEPHEIELATTLAKQMAMALQARELAYQAKLVALAQARQEAAEERATVVGQVNASLRSSVERLTACSDVDSAIIETLAAMSEVLSDRGVVEMGLVQANATRESIKCRFLHRDGKMVNLKGSPLDRDFQVDEPEMAIPWRRVQEEEFVWGPTYDPSVLVPAVRAYHEGRGTRAVAYQPLHQGGNTIGWVAVSLSSDQPPTEAQILLIRTLGGQVSLALEFARLADEASCAAILKERQRIVGDMHDTLAQCFTGIWMQLQAATEYLAKDHETAVGCLDRAKALSRQGLREARKSVLALAPDEEFHDLAAAICEIAERSTTHTASPAAVTILGTPRLLPGMLASNVLHIFREALGNAVRYAQADKIAIELLYTKSCLELRIVDKGRGFGFDQAVTAGFGLRGMQDRAQRIGASLEIHSAVGLGTTVLLSLKSLEADPQQT